MPPSLPHSVGAGGGRRGRRGTGRRAGRRAHRRLPAAGLLPVGQQLARQAPARHDAARRLLRPAAQGAGEALPDPEVHLQARPQEARREARPQGLAGEDLVPEPAHEVAQLEGARAAGERRLPRADAAQQEQPAPGPQRRGGRPPQDGPVGAVATGLPGARVGGQRLRRRRRRHRRRRLRPRRPRAAGVCGGARHAPRRGGGGGGGRRLRARRRRRRRRGDQRH
ncbi:GD13658, partial [Gryllus bimaculatus]